MQTVNDAPVWEMEYKLHEPFGRGHWTVCRSKDEARFHLRNIANNLPHHFVYVHVFEDDKETPYKARGADMYERIFGKESQP